MTLGDSIDDLDRNARAVAEGINRVVREQNDARASFLCVLRARGTARWIDSILHGYRSDDLTMVAPPRSAWLSGFAKLEPMPHQRAAFLGVLAVRVDAYRGWGLWGGRAPGGWACFRVAGRGDGWPPGWSHRGTRAEAEAGAVAFRLEFPGSAYTVVPFDADREPVGVMARPSPAQVAVLDHVDRFHTINRLPFFSRTTTGACHDRGWVMHVAGESAMRLTKVGAEVLAKWRHMVPERGR